MGLANDLPEIEVGISTEGRAHFTFYAVGKVLHPITERGYMSRSSAELECRSFALGYQAAGGTVKPGLQTWENVEAPAEA